MKLYVIKEIQVRKSGKVFRVSPGGIVEITDPRKAQGLITSGHVKPLLPPDKDIYKDSKTPVPSVPIEVSRPYWQRADGSCYACHGTESWLSVYGVLVCVRCHPPASQALVVRWGHA